MASECNDLESSTKDRDSRVREAQYTLGVSQVMRCTWNSAWICPDHWISLNTTWQPIVN